MAGEACTLPAGNFQGALADGKKKTKVSNPPLDIDKDIQFLCRPLDEEAYCLLEKDIRENGCLDPIIYWEDGGKNKIVDGHNRYEICNRLGKKIKIRSMRFETKEEVMNYVIDHQLGRRNLSDMEKSYLRGKRYLTEKKASHRPNGSELHQDDGVTGETAQKIAEQTGVSQATIERDAVLAEAIDKTRESVGDEFIKDLRAEKFKLTKKSIIDLSEKPPEDLKAIVELIKEGKKMSAAEKIVQDKKGPSSDQSEDSSPLPEDDKNIKKIEGYLAQVLKILKKMKTTSQPDKLMELSEMAGKICDLLKEIGAKNPDSSSQDIVHESNDPQVQNNQVTQDDAEEESANGCPESIEEDDPAKLPEGWDGYEEAMENLAE
jgi:ParB-like chromosome segregation protein Spo0J